MPLYSDAECRTVDWLDILALATIQLVVECFRNIDTGRLPPKTLIRRHPHTFAIALELDDEERIDPALVLVGRFHICPWR